MKIVFLIVMIFLSDVLHAEKILIPMDASQTNHLKAYGIIFNHLGRKQQAQWLLNYRGGSFMTERDEQVLRACLIRGVAAEVISDSRAAQIIREIELPEANTAVIMLQKAPKIAVYTPDQKLPWDDAVTLAMTYAEVPYEKVWDREVLAGKLSDYDWLHLHHEDFTGQYGKFWAAYRNQPWYMKQVREIEQMARELGFTKVSEEKKAVARKIKDYVEEGGFLFAMCSGTDTFDIALAAENVDIVPQQFDGDPADSDVDSKLDFSKTLAFEKFEIYLDPAKYEHSSIDIPVELGAVDQMLDYFTLFEFSAKWDPVPTMLTQNHVSSVKGFFGQATAYQKNQVKSSVVILAEIPGKNQVKYLHGNHGKGTFTFYGGHDPEDYTHRVDDPPTDLNLHPASPGYRLILNNILFPAAEKKKRKT
jgi:hypothetical protein